MAKENKKIPLVELFGPTIQGEGAVIGQQTYFMRFGLCDYLCKMCDSLHAVKPELVKENAEWLTQDDIYAKFLNFRKEPSTSWVTFSGGNPCIHDLTQLVIHLNEGGYSICVETQGTKAPMWLNGVQAISVSPKGPGMGEKTDLKVLDDFMIATIGHPGLYMKIVVFDERDLEFSAMLYERYVMEKHCLRNTQFFLSLGNPYPPGRNGLDDNISDPLLRKVGLQRLLVERYTNMLPDILRHPVLNDVKFLPQWHVIVWGNKQGV